MKYCLFIAIVIFAIPLGFGQKRSTENLLSDIYTLQEIAELQENGLKQTYLEYAVKGFFLTQRTPINGKYVEIDEVLLTKTKESVPVQTFMEDFNSPSFNPLKYSWRPNKTRQYIHLKDTDIYITIPSLKDLKR